MGKTIVYLALLSILGLSVYFIFFQNKEGGLYQDKEANFTFRDTANIGKIFLVDNDGKSILLERKPDNTWLLNKKFIASPIQIINILTCLKMQEAHVPVGDKEHDRVIKLLAGSSTKVEVYDLKGEKIRSFFVAGQGPNYHGSYMILEKGEQAYLVDIPGFEGYLTPRYSIDVNEWRSRAVFDLTANNISNIKIDYIHEPLNSFQINNANTSPTVTIDPNLASSFTQLNLERVKIYLNGFTKINSESILNDFPSMDSIISHSVQRCRMQVISKAGKNTVLDIYWKDGRREMDLSDQTSTDSSRRPTDVERMFAVNQSNHDTMLIQARTFEKFFRVGYEFYQKDEPVVPEKQTRPAPPLR